MRKKISLSDLVLLSLEKAVDGVVRTADFTYHPWLYAFDAGFSRHIKKSSLSVALKRLREQGFIDLEKYNEGMVLKLTKEGKGEALMRKIFLDEKWDGKWRIVIFDIPEKHKKVRNALRNKLKTWGFSQLQKSVWTSKKNVTEPLKAFVQTIGVEKWVLVIESTNAGFVQFTSDRK